MTQNSEAYQAMQLAANRLHHLSMRYSGVLVERNRNSERIQRGDSLWWQGSWAMWTPQGNCGREGNRCGVDYDIKIPRIGYSGVRHPSRTKEGD